MRSVFTITVLYSQVIVCNALMESPYNDWSNEHVAQGFSWRPGSVSFEPAEDGGKCYIELIVNEELAIDENAERVIIVPFTVLPPGIVELSGIAEYRRLDIPPDTYSLRYETGHRNGDMWCRFILNTAMSVEPKIIRPGTLSPPNTLCMSAMPV